MKGETENKMLAVCQIVKVEEAKSSGSWMSFGRSYILGCPFFQMKCWMRRNYGVELHWVHHLSASIFFF